MSGGAVYALQGYAAGEITFWAMSVYDGSAYDDVAVVVDAADRDWPVGVGFGADRAASVWLDPGKARRLAAALCRAAAEAERRRLPAPDVKVTATTEAGEPVL